MSGPQRILLVGDLHLNTRAALQTIAHARDRGAELVVQVGDFGFWPRMSEGQEYLRTVDARLATAGLELWFVPGNHEDWASLAELTPGEDGLLPIADHVRGIPTGHRWTWGSTRWLAVGGATSVDRHLRTEGLDWFSDEEVTEAQIAATIEGGPVDVVVAHDAPMGTPLLYARYKQHLPPWQRDSWWPISALMASDAHQERMHRILDSVGATRWFHGHHHVRYTSTMTTGHGDVEVVGLALDGTPLNELTLLVDASGRPIVGA